MTERPVPERPVTGFRCAVAGGCAAIVLLLMILAAWPQLHCWLHGEKHLDPNDHCVVVLFTHGVTGAGAAVAVTAIFLVQRREYQSEPAALHLVEPRFRRPPVCGPPIGA